MNYFIDFIPKEDFYENINRTYEKLDSNDNLVFNIYFNELPAMNVNKCVYCDTNEGIKYIQSLHIKEGVIDFNKQEYYVREEWANDHPKIHKDQLLIVQTGDIGQVGLVNSDYDNCNCHALIIVSLNKQIVLPKFVTYYFMGHPGKELLLRTKTGALLPHLNSTRIGSTPICYPSYKEQEQIAEFLDTKCSEINSLICEKEAMIADLEAYKKSLIFEVVTGKRKVC